MYRFAFMLIGVLIGTPALAGDVTIRDKHGRTTGTVERYLWTDTYVIRDREGRTQGTIEPNLWTDDYVVRDREGRTRGVIESSDF